MTIVIICNKNDDYDNNDLARKRRIRRNGKKTTATAAMAMAMASFASFCSRLITANCGLDSSKCKLLLLCVLNRKLEQRQSMRTAVATVATVANVQPVARFTCKATAKRTRTTIATTTAAVAATVTAANAIANAIARIIGCVNQSAAQQQPPPAAIRALTNCEVSQGSTNPATSVARLKASQAGAMLAASGRLQKATTVAARAFISTTNYRLLDHRQLANCNTR